MTINCALCHTTAYRLAPDDAPRVAYGGPELTANIQGLLRFLFATTRDPRFSAAEMLPLIERHSRPRTSER